MTGLSRAEVKKLAESLAKPHEASPSRQRALRVVDGWLSDVDFLSPEGDPKPLTLQPDGGQFGVLVRRYSGDIPTRAILRELERLELVSVSEAAITLLRVALDQKPLRQLEMISEALVDLLTKFSAKPTPATRLMSREITLSVPDSKAHRILHKQMQEAIRTFFTSLQNAADGGSLPRKKRTGRKKQTYVTVLVSD
jgi:hypothetical protein